MRKQILFAGAALLGLLLLAMPSFVGAQTITVTSPAGGSQWCKGNSYDIKWNKTGGQSSKVEIRLFDQAMTTPVLTIAGNASNNGYYPKWEAPKNLPAGTYRIRVRARYSQVMGDSAPFQIRDCISPGMIKQVPAQGLAKDVKQAPSGLAQQIAPAISVQSPAAGSVHETGAPLPIRWNRNIISTYGTVDIHLLDKPHGTVRETIKNGAPNTGEYNAWTAPQKYSFPGTFSVVRIATPDGKMSGHSGSFSIINPPPAKKKKMPFMVDAQIINSWAYQRYGDLRPTDCLYAPQIQPGRQPGPGEVKIGHFNKEGKHGECSYADWYYLRSRVFFDMDYYKGKEIVEAALVIRLGDSIEFVPSGTLATNEELSSRCDIYLLNGPWPASPQPLYDFYPGTLVRNFSLYTEGETAKVDLLDVVKDWVAGKPNHGLMLRGPLNRSKYFNSACVKYYHSVRLVGWYLE